MQEPIVHVETLIKQYNDVTAVNGISLDVYPGEIFSLVGPNGAGKTTIVEILECLRVPTSGQAFVLGFDVKKDENKIKKRIGVMPQDFNAFERLTVEENVKLIAKIYGVDTDIHPVLQELGILEERKRRFEELSGGMKRRVGISMALVSDPELLFLDEPTTGLDPQGRRETWDVIKKLKKLGKTVFLTSHYMEEVEYLSDRAAVIVKGDIIAAGAVQDLVSEYGGGIKVEVENGDEKVKEIVDSLADRVITNEGITSIFHNQTSAGKALAAIYQLGDYYTVNISEPGMDEVFLELAGARVDERGELI
jgi:ABC-2 type transport system ATP-binding protein